MHDARTINPYFHIDFCKRNASTILTTSVGLTPINTYNWSIKYSVAINKTVQHSVCGKTFETKTKFRKISFPNFIVFHLYMYFPE